MVIKHDTPLVDALLLNISCFLVPLALCFLRKGDGGADPETEPDLEGEELGEQEEEGAKEDSQEEEDLHAEDSVEECE